MSQIGGHYVSPLGSNRGRVALWLVILSVALLFLLAIAGAPLAAASGPTSLSLTIYQAFGHLCHQLPERSFYIAGQQFAVCARCTGLYAGFAVMTMLYPAIVSLRRRDMPARKWLFLAALPMALDVGVDLLGIWQNTHSSRFVTGALLGGTAVFYVLPGLLQITDRRLWASEERAKLPALTVTTKNMASAPSDYSAPNRRI
jgi:uncharacterized membrane protein